MLLNSCCPCFWIMFTLSWFRYKMYMVRVPNSIIPFDWGTLPRLIVFCNWNLRFWAFHTSSWQIVICLVWTGLYLWACTPCTIYSSLSRGEGYIQWWTFFVLGSLQTDKGLSSKLGSVKFNKAKTLRVSFFRLFFMVPGSAAVQLNCTTTDSSSWAR